MPTMKKEKTDIRTNVKDVRAKVTPKGQHVIEGKAIVFNQQSEYMGFYEIIKPEAVEGIDWSKTLLLYDHEFSNILARVDAGNLDIEVKKDGVYFTAELNNSTLANDVFNDIASGNVKGCSFGFNIAKGGDDWDILDDGTPLHIVTKIETIPELSLTPVPAYTQTNASIVRHLESIKKEGKSNMDKEKEIKNEKPVEEPTKEQEPKAEKEVKAKVDVNTDDIMKAIQSVKELIEQAKEVKGSDNKPKEEQRDIKPEKDKDDEDVQDSVDAEEPVKENKPENSEEVVINADENKEPETQSENDDDKAKGSENIGGKKDMTQILKDKEENKKPVEVRNFEAWLKGEQRDLTQGQNSSNSDAVLPSQVLDLLKQPNDPTQLASYVNRVAVSAPAGKLPVLAKATARLATTAELAENPNIAEATIKKVAFDLETYRGQLPVSNEMVSDYPDITSILAEYVDTVKKETEQVEIGKVLQTATAKSVTSLDEIKGLYNGLLNYGTDRKFVVSASMFNELDTMKDAEGRYLLKDDITAETGRSLFGAELIVVPDEVLGSAGDKKMFIGSLKAFVTEAVKGEVSMRWEQNTNFENVLGVAIRMDVVAGDTDAGYFVTYTEASKA